MDCFIAFGLDVLNSKAIVGQQSLPKRYYIMNNFLDDDFLFQSEFAKILYPGYAKDLPIIDYHNHLSPSQIEMNHQFGSISEAWLAGDYYKWRAMRAIGVNEKFITGNATDKEKFVQWANTVPYTVRNPLCHWTHLKLQRYFGIHELLWPSTAEGIYERTNTQLEQESHRTQGLSQQQKVESLCTTDYPTDALEHHKSIWEQGISSKVYPTIRPDKAFALPNRFASSISPINCWVKSNTEIVLVGLVKVFLSSVMLSPPSCPFSSNSLIPSLNSVFFLIRRLFKRATDDTPL